MSSCPERVLDIRCRNEARSRAPIGPVDLDRVARGVREILLAVGEDPDRDGLRETPSRVARAYAEALAGLREDPGDHLKRTFEDTSGGVVSLTGIEFTSLCEHHLLPVLGTAHVAYLPSNARVVGLSKIARTVDVFARRPQLQERMTAQIADALVEHLDPLGVLVLIEGRHLCLAVRGAEKPGSVMRTVATRGLFAEDPLRKREVLDLLGPDLRSGGSL